MVVQVDQAFAHLLKQYREQGRVSQSRLAELSGFDHSYVSRLESGHRSPTREAVIRFAEALSLDQPDRDNLLAAAGFMPTRVESLLADEPVLTEVFQLLQSPSVPQSVREDVRQMLQLVLRQARLAAANQRAAQDEDQVLAAD
jgi:transcriptional regulator with XRE-family HTH domain